MIQVLIPVAVYGSLTMAQITQLAVSLVVDAGTATPDTASGPGDEPNGDGDKRKLSLEGLPCACRASTSRPCAARRRRRTNQNLSTRCSSGRSSAARPVARGTKARVPIGFSVDGCIEAETITAMTLPTA